jgi:uncharacterized protein YoaH (UPF0181 family)
LPNCLYDYESDYPIRISFACKEQPPINREYCIFNDRDHHAEHQQEAVERLEEIVSECVSQSKPVECIGYYLLHINFARLLKENTFAQPFYFSKETFYEGA